MADRNEHIHRTARADAISLRSVVAAFLRRRPTGATLAEIYEAVNDDRPSTSDDAIRGELNHGVSNGRYVRLGEVRPVGQRRVGGIAEEATLRR